jgi:1-acyl-sn-glycerol-3-phosphate acyltransferase
VLRTLWVLATAPIVTAVLALQIVVADLLGFERALKRYCHRNPRWSARTFLWAAGVKVRFEGLEHLAGHGPRVLIANHESWFDVFALSGCLPVEYRFVIKKELEKVPIWGRAWRDCGHISVDRRNHQSAVQSLARARAMSEGDDILMVVYPEGTRSPDGHLLPFKMGAFVLALQLNAPLIPVAVFGSRQIMTKGDWRIRSGDMRVVIGEPIPVAGLAHGDRDELARRGRAAIVALRGGEGPVEAPPRTKGVA